MTAMSSAPLVILPHGLHDEDGVCHREAVLRPLTGREELLLGSAGRTNSPRVVSELLAACLERLGGYEPVDAGLTASLTRGDRKHLALRLRAALFGDRLTLIARCPAPSCQELADVDLSISDLLVDRAAPAPEHIEVQVAEGTARLREPTGEDDEVVTSFGGEWTDRSALLWSRLVQLEGKPISPAGWLGLSKKSRHTLALALAEQTSAPDLLLLSRCPECEAWLEVGLDPFALLGRELAHSGARLEAEVHCLAFRYHWSEADILSLPRTRRWRYLELLRRELEGRPLLDGWS